MDHLLLLLWSSGVRAKGKHNSAEFDDVRLVGGASRCAGTLETKHLGEWRPVVYFNWTLNAAAVVCEHLDCGSALTFGRRPQHPLISPDSVRLLNGSSLCSGRLEVKSNQSWSSVCEADFDQQDAEVVCRELGCGPPSVLQGALYGEVEAPVWSREFQCGGHESALLDCRSSGSARSSCSPGKAAGLTCSEPVRLVGGASRCAGTLEVKHLGDWRPVDVPHWTLKESAVVCEHLDCGSAVSVGWKEAAGMNLVSVHSDCVKSGSSIKECITLSPFSSMMKLYCTDSVRLLNGSSLCSGRLEVKSNQSWSSVCEADFDQQDAEVVCRELGCGPPSVLQGALYGEVEAPVWSREFQCGGHESALLDCRSSGSARNSCSPGKAAGLTCSEPDVRLVGGASRCAETLEVKHLGDWRPVEGSDWMIKKSAVVCEHLDCGSAVSVGWREESSPLAVWVIRHDCVQFGSALRDCAASNYSSSIMNITCSDSVRLLNGSSLCSGRLEVKSNQSWSSMCEADFDQQDAEVVCRELGCGPPSVLQGALYGEVEAPVWSREFQCGGHESALLDCRSSGSARSSCSPGKAVGLTCSEFDDVRLVGGASRCAGTLEVKHRGLWRQVDYSDWTMKAAAVVCAHLDCGSVLTFKWRVQTHTSVWKINPDCVQSGSSLMACATLLHDSVLIVDLNCSDSVRLLNGSSLCSGRLEVKSNQSWSSVCEADFDQQDAEVVCRELGCGPPSVLQGALYGEVEAPVWSREFQCRGHESALLDCRSSGSARTSCSPGKAVGLTCSEPVRLVGGASRCAGILELKRLVEWRPVDYIDWTLKAAAVACEHLDCGSALTFGLRLQNSTFVWKIKPDCVDSGSALMECATSDYSPFILDFTCSDSVRLLNGSSLCSGRLEVKSDQSWSSVCEADFDQQDAEVVCRELGCGPPSVLQGALYGEVEAPVWSREFQCGGHESALLDCRSSGSARSSCSPGKAVGLTCSEPVRLVGGASRCAGILELKRLGEWRPVDYIDWTLKAAAVACEHLDCGSALTFGWRLENYTSVWKIKPDCVDSGSALMECATSDYSPLILDLTCSDLLVQPIISLSSMDGVSEGQQGLLVSRSSNFTISCSIQPQYPGGSFHLTFNKVYKYTQAAVNHSAHFLFPAAEPAHQGSYSCVYDVYVFSHNFSSESRLLSVTVSEFDDVRLVGGASRCAGTLEVKHRGLWRQVDYFDWTMKAAAVVCAHLDCGSALTFGRRPQHPTSVWKIKPDCVDSGSALMECAASDYSSRILDLTCSDSVRLLNGSSLCSGRLEVKSNQSWSSVCEADFDQQAAEVVCRELGCGPPSVLQGALYGEVEAPVWSREFQCGGHESALLDCRSSGSARSSCSPGKAVGLTCSEVAHVRLVGGASHCTGKLEMKHLGEWRPLVVFDWRLITAAVTCEHLDCGSAVFREESSESPRRPVWKITAECVLSRSSLKECVTSQESYVDTKINCSDSVRLLNGSSLCSGRLEVKSNQSWSSVCEADFDQQAAEVVCRELGCGPPSVLQGALYGEVEAPVWSREFQCGGHESALLDCRSSGSARSSCSPGKAVGLTCSEVYHVRLVGGTSHCTGTLELKHLGEWRPVEVSDWRLKTAAVFCAHLDCGSAILTEKGSESPYRPVWEINAECVQSQYSLKECLTSQGSHFDTKLKCSDSVRLLNGSSLCSGRLEVKSNQSWSSVCEADFDQQDAEVVCRELGCGPPSVLQGALYGEVEAPVWSREFQCGGHESALLDCRRSGSARSSCSPGKAVGLTCSEPFRLVEGVGRCDGTLEIKHVGEWRPVGNYDETMKRAAVYCEYLDCGSVTSVRKRRYSKPVRLVGGANRCDGTLEMKMGVWRSVEFEEWTLKEAATFLDLH
ncbi:scavenger receptor cysteine-rich type 1 protein M130-like [Archocentrus centrarchus]|uniref:scavenger receptor cysteine-rich type 1 protein M130-like n=1 Tax=Archocentrus centrarchus TaxID=63155 RepID=UPI0011EA0313|nr:scavenger receptor cysteine-rich type 1 protein M130-like [Archocentrus centrarchus]